LTCLVATLEKPREKEGMDLMFKVLNIPAFTFGFDFIEQAFVPVLNIHQSSVMGPSQIGRESALPIDLLYG
jgi:hypothetical protein